MGRGERGRKKKSGSPGYCKKKKSGDIIMIQPPDFLAPNSSTVSPSGLESMNKMVNVEI
jgi:hypothetical protein